MQPSTPDAGKKFSNIVVVDNDDGEQYVKLSDAQVTLNASDVEVGSVEQGDPGPAGSPWSFRLSDGAAFYNAPTSAQLPAALDTDALKVREQGIPHVVVDSMPAAGAGLTDTELRATPVPVEQATVDADGGGS